MNIRLNLQIPVIAALLICHLPALNGQQKDIPLKNAEKMHAEYHFEQALEAYKNLLPSITDSLQKSAVQDRIIQCENGISLMEYVVRPITVSQKDVDLSDFYLFVEDLPDHSWIPIPNPLIRQGGHKYYNSVYFPEGQKRHIFSAPDEKGMWNLYVTEQINDRHWSAPALLSENLRSARNEIFPMLSRDGQTLYFASDGFAGMGGYDLFMSRRNAATGDWETPVNLGFPYSSTSDDIFFHNSLDGNYSILASNRESPSGAIRLYVTRFIATPVKTSIGPDESAAELALMPVAEEYGRPARTQKEKKKTTADSTVSDMSSYSGLVYRMRDLQEQYESRLKKLEESRLLYAKAARQDKDFLANKIMEVENEAMNLKKELDEASVKIQKAEMDFLARGVIPVLQEKEENETGTASEDLPEYTFRKHEPGDIPVMEVEEPVPTFDYSFRILPEGQFAEDNNLPDGLLYQVQIAALNKKAAIKDLKGLSPVFFRRISGKYVHYVGVFRTYSEVSANLGKIKRKFSGAFIVAYNNGKKISVKNARLMESRKDAGAAFQIILKGYPDGLPSTIITTIRETSKKDISKAFIDNQTIYMAGPFESRSDAEYLLRILKDLGIDKATIESIKL